MEAKDKLGQPITKGCYIIYGHALGRCAGLRVGKVLNVKERKDSYHGTEFSITVHGVEDDWKHDAPTLCQKKGTLLFPNRIVVVPIEMLSPEHRALLEPLEVL